MGQRKLCRNIAISVAVAVALLTLGSFRNEPPSRRRLARCEGPLPRGWMQQLNGEYLTADGDRKFYRPGCPYLAAGGALGGEKSSGGFCSTIMNAMTPEYFKTWCGECQNTGSPIHRRKKRDTSNYCDRTGND